MNLNRYVDDYGCYTFQDVSFNEVDNAVMSAISYVNLDGIVSKSRFHKITIGEAGKIYFEKHSKKEKQVENVPQIYGGGFVRYVCRGGYFRRRYDVCEQQQRRRLNDKTILRRCGDSHVRQ